MISFLVGLESDLRYSIHFATFETNDFQALGDLFWRQQLPGALVVEVKEVAVHVQVQLWVGLRHDVKGLTQELRQ